MRKLALFVCLLLCFVVVPLPSVSAQVNDLVTLNAQPAFDGLFRANQWMPLRVEIENNGGAIQGAIVLRPETSGSALPNTFSVPVDLPANTTQSLFLYASARGNANVLRVELLNDLGAVVTSRDVNVREILPRDQLYVVVTEGITSAVDLSTIRVGGYQAFQANWLINNIPTHTGALDAVNAMVISDADTGNLTAEQQQTIGDWVTGGGHLIVTGGAAWQSTAAGLENLLPLIPTTSTTINDISPLAALAGRYNTQLNGDTIIAQGNLIDDATVLAQTAEGIPLVARRQLGNGVVDYITADPATEPLRSWQDLSQLWLTLITTTDARPSWTYGFADWSKAVRSVEILPGVDLLPAVLALIGFLALYIALIGPLNYIILNRLNRREWAWVTIPILIAIFSVLAWSVGFEIRGNQATLSRLTVVQTWPDTNEAHIDQLIGLLAPRRDEYTLSMTDNRMIRPISATLSNANVLGNRLQLEANIRQTSRFEAVEFPVDASFIAAFNTQGTIEKPDISGSLTLTFSEGDIPVETLQGAIRNNSDMVLNDPVILARGTAFRLNTPLAPGDIQTFTGTDLALSDAGGPLPSTMEYAANDPQPFLGTTSLGFRGSLSAYSNAATRTASDILGEDNYQTFNFGVSFNDDEETQEIRRRQAFLDSFIIDQYASTARGNRVYLVGWTDSAPTEEEIGGSSYDVVDTTLYIVELDVTRDETRQDELTTITQDQFSWVSLVRDGSSDIGPSNMMVFNESEFVFRFTPLPDSVLREVEELTIIARRTRSTWTEGIFSLWNWQDSEWEVIDMGEENQTTLRNAERFIGPQNAVQVRLLREGVGGSINIQQLGIEQRGRF